MKRLIQIGPIFLVLICACCGTAPPPHEETITHSTTTANASAVASPPIEGPDLHPKGENAKFSLGTDLKETLSSLRAPHVWLEYSENDQTRQIELPPEAKESLDKQWQSLLSYRIAKDFSEDPSQIATADYNCLIETANSANFLEETEVSRAGKITKLREDEAHKILQFQAGLLRSAYSDMKASFPDEVRQIPTDNQ